jgi:hypothetical protein
MNMPTGFARDTEIGFPSVVGSADTGFVIGTWTSSAATTTTITAAGLADVAGLYIGQMVLPLEGAMAGEARYIIAYNGTTQLTVSPAWASDPDAAGNIQFSVVAGTGSAISTVALGTDGTTVTDSATNVIGAIGVNNANNAFSSSSVVPNADGSLMERTDYLMGLPLEALNTAIPAAPVALSANALLKGQVIYVAPVTTGGTTTFSSTQMAGYGVGRFVNWIAFCTYDVGGAVAAPQGESQIVTAYTNTGDTVGTAFTTLATGDIIILINPATASKYGLDTVQGGGETLQSIKDDLSTGLDLARSPWSGTYTIATGGAHSHVYTESDTQPFFFGGFSVDLTAMAAGDTMIIKIYKMIKSGGTLLQISDNYAYTYTDAQVPALKEFNLNTYNVYGIDITIELSVGGTNRAVDVEIFDAKRGV